MTRSFLFRTALVPFAAAVLLSGCSIVIGPVSDCTTDAECKALEGGADLVCDVDAKVCVYQACESHDACAGLGAGYFCEAREGVTGKTCVKKSCTANTDCESLGDDVGCVASTCQSVCRSAKYAVAGASRDKEVRLGAILPLTAADGTENAAQRIRLWSIELATHEVNEFGGVSAGVLTPRKLNTRICDSRSDVGLAERLARHLADTGHKAILTTNTAETARVLGVAKAKGAVVMSVSATATALSLDVSQNPPTPVDNGGLFFRTAPRDDVQAEALARRLRVEDSTEPNIAIIHEANDYGRGLAAGILSEWPAAKVKIAQVDPASPTAGNFADLGATTPRFVLIFANAQNAAAIVKKIQETTGLAKARNVTYVFGDAATNKSLVDALGTDAPLIENAAGSLPFVDTQTSPYQSLRANYNSFRSNPLHGGVTSAFDTDGTFGPNTYDAMYLLTLAAAKGMASAGGSVDFTGKIFSDRLKELSDVNAPADRTVRVGPTDLRKAFTLWGTSGGISINVQGASGAIDFDAGGDVGGTFQWCRFLGNPPSFSLGNCDRITN